MSTKRRGSGEGSIFRRADGLWAAAIVVGYNGSGKRLRRTVYGKTKTEVQAKLSILHSQRATGTLTKADRMTVAAYLATWLNDYSRPRVRVTTHLSYATIIEKQIVPRIGGVVLQSLTPLHVQGLYTAMERDGRSPRMRQLTHGVLRTALKKALRMGLIVRNVCDAVDPPRATRRDITPLDHAQAQQLIEAGSADRFDALYVLALTTGLRQGELFGLRWPDVDLDRGTVTVIHSLTDVPGGLLLCEPKSRAGRRCVKLPSIAVNALLEHRKRMLAEGHAGAFVFCGRGGGPLRKSNFCKRHFKPLLKAAGLPNIRFHDLRHTAATLLLLAGEHPKVVQERLGHARISLTMDTYSHVLPNIQAGAVDKLDILFPKAAPA
jgi:integrase